MFASGFKIMGWKGALCLRKQENKTKWKNISYTILKFLMKQDGKNWSFFRNWLAYILIFHVISIYIIFFNRYVMGVLKPTYWKLLLYLTMLNYSHFNKRIQKSLQSSHVTSFVPLSLALPFLFPVSSRIHFLFYFSKHLLLWGLFVLLC